jgi:PAP_fibrillin
LQDEQMTAEEVKGALLDSFWGIDRGLTATAETRADINELISQLEAKSPCENPTEVRATCHSCTRPVHKKPHRSPRMLSEAQSCNGPSVSAASCQRTVPAQRHEHGGDFQHQTSHPLQAADKLGGTWKLVYTSGSELMGLLALNNLPFVTIGDIKQTIDARAATVVNTLDISLPGSTTSLSATAAVTVQSPKRFNVKFEKGTIGTPQLMSEVDIPDSVMVLGQNVDLRTLKQAIRPAQDASRDIISRVRA